MNNCATIVRLGEIRKHPQADRLMLTTIFGNQVIVGLDAKEGDLGIYFETGLQLSEEFAKANDLIRRKDDQGKPAGGMFDENRRVRTQTLRGEKSDGFWCPIFYLDNAVGGPCRVQEGQEFNSFCGLLICQKYIPRTNPARNSGTGPQPKKKRVDSVMFKEHFDTAHFGKNVDKIPVGARVVITEKLHGTSQRVGHVLVEFEPNFIQKVARWIYEKVSPDTLDFSRYQYLNGTRRVVIQPKNKGTGYHSDDLRDIAAKPFIGNLKKGETVYFEVVGFEPSGKCIMPQCGNDKLGKEFVQRYGQSTTFSYGCEHATSDVFVYRMTTTNEDGQSYDYTWDDVKLRCEELGVKYVPELYSFVVEDHRDLTDEVERLASKPSILDDTHIREGVCVRVEGTGFNIQVYKHKSFEFKVLEGIIKDAGVVDQEEEQSVEEAA